MEIPIWLLMALFNASNERLAAVARCLCNLVDVRDTLHFHVSLHRSLILMVYLKDERMRAIKVFEGREAPAANGRERLTRDVG